MGGGNLEVFAVLGDGAADAGWGNTALFHHQIDHHREQRLNAFVQKIPVVPLAYDSPLLSVCAHLAQRADCCAAACESVCNFIQTAPDRSYLHSRSVL